MVVPTAPRHPTVNETLAAPISTNTFLGTFTHFGNVLDLCAAAIPAGTYSLPDSSGVLPFSITMLGGERTDADVLNIAQRFEERLKLESETQSHQHWIVRKSINGKRRLSDVLNPIFKLLRLVRIRPSPS